MNFLIPTNIEELLEPSRLSNVFCVKELLPIRQLQDKLEECYEYFKLKGPTFILEYFEIFFTILSLWEQVNTDLKEKTWLFLLRVQVEHNALLSQLLTLEEIDPEEIFLNRTAIKMIIFALCKYSEAFGNNLKNFSQNKKSKVNDHQLVPTVCNFDYKLQRGHFLNSLWELLQLDIFRLWNSPVIDEDLISLITTCCYKILEDPEIIKLKETKITIFNILGIITKKWHDTLGASLKILQLLQLFDHLVVPLAECIEIFVHNFNLESIINDLVREIGQINPRDHICNTNGARSYSTFLIEIAQRIPTIMLPSLSLILHLLDEESHILRISLLTVVAEIIVHVLSSKELELRLKNKRDQLLGKLEEHILDINAFVRSKVLQLWLYLYKERAVPLNYLPLLLESTIERLQDKSSIVRKSAIQLLSNLLCGNPFSSKLSLEELKINLNQENKKLERLSKNLNFNLQTCQTLENNESSFNIKQMNNENSDNLLKQKNLIEYLKDSIQFAEKIQNAFPLLYQLLGSKSSTDVLETIHFFVTANEFGISEAHAGMHVMLPLIWSKENIIKEALISAYAKVYLMFDNQNLRLSPLETVNNLISLTNSISVGEFASLEELICELMKKNLLPNQTVQVLWEFYTLKAKNVSLEQSRKAALLLGMVARVDINIIKSNIEVLVDVGFGERGSRDFLFARETCLIFNKLSLLPKENGILTDPFRLPMYHTIFCKIGKMLANGISNVNDNSWISFAEQAIITIYNLAEHPDLVCSEIIKKLSSFILNECDLQFEDKSKYLVDVNILSRFIAFTGQVALQQLIFLDETTNSELKRRNHFFEKDPTLLHINIKDSDTSQDDSEVEIGFSGTNIDETTTEYIKRICENQIVTGDNLLTMLYPLLMYICANKANSTHNFLRTSAVLALSKMMLVSSELCENQLQLLFTILEEDPLTTIRANTIVALGDLCFRFPNQLEPWTPNLYARLKDKSVDVRRNALMVLTHLILHDMIKVKGQISEIASCIVDSEQSISKLAQLFFYELAKKGNSVYNILPDIISHLSDSKEEIIQESDFQTIMKFLFSFIQKEKQIENIVEKLCHRFRPARTESQVINLAFCLSTLNFSEKVLKKLHENFACFSLRLINPVVSQYFMIIINKAKKFPRPGTKVLLDDLEAKINRAQGQVEDLE